MTPGHTGFERVGCTNSILPAKTPSQAPRLTSPRTGRITPKNSEVDRGDALRGADLLTDAQRRIDGQSHMVKPKVLAPAGNGSSAFSKRRAPRAQNTAMICLAERTGFPCKIRMREFTNPLRAAMAANSPCSADCSESMNALSEGIPFGSGGFRDLAIFPPMNGPV
jgi:hypothetical protein